ncbi:MAG: IgGFc-binding protein [Myxococcota bacterium]|nr:IgGFc-binding protein [Myxococcota bacterium]
MLKPPLRLCLSLSLVLGLLIGPSACGESEPDGFGSLPEPEPIDPSDLCNDPEATRCDGLDFEVCVEGRWFPQETCEAPLPACDPDLGCTQCIPSARFCVSRDVYACGPEGTTAELVDTCETGEECILGQCYDSCSLAENSNSYLGCRFLAVGSANVLHPAFSDDFAVVVTNPSNQDPADVVIRQGGQTLATETVAPGGTEAVQLSLGTQLQDWSESQVVSGGAYEVTSSIPIAAYQYNPLHFRITQTDGSSIHSFTNDASLLLPEHVLTGSYMASTRPTFGTGDFPGESEWTPGFVVVAATADNTTVTITTTANTQGGDLAALEVGGSTELTLQRGDVLQLVSEIPVASLQTNTCLLRGGAQASNGESQSCLDSQLGDLTGSRVEASQPVAVFAGHVCTFVPFDRYACDHLEETMFPLQTWGSQTVMTAPRSPDQTGIVPTLYRVLSRDDTNFVSFTPEVNAPVELNAGEFVEFLSSSDFLVNGTAPVFVTQTMLGEDALGTQSGDPALGSGIPLNQWRSEYFFLVPDTYTSNWMNIVAPQGAVVYLDGVLIEDWEWLSEIAYQVARIEVEAGSHHVQSVGEIGFGITSYGYAPYTSYLLPGGMNFLR